MVQKALLLLAVATVALTVWIGGTTYLGRRLISDPGLGEPWTTLLTGLLAALALGPLLHGIAERVAPPRISRLLAWPANLFLGFAFYLLIGLLVVDGALLLLGAVFGDDPSQLVARSRALAVTSFAGVAGLLAMRSGLAPPRLHQREIRLRRWPGALDGFRVVQISDVHIGSMLDGRFAAAIVERVNALAPDLIAVTGDLVDGPVTHLAAEVRPFGELEAPHGVFFVTGNHDYYSGADPWLEEVRRLGMRPLRNERVTVSRDGGTFDLAGVDDHRGHMFGPGHGEDVATALAGRDPGVAVVLLAHDPSTFTAARRHDVDLQISGHTHGGQLWPFGYLVRAAVGYVAGHYVRGGSQLFVSNGTGYWGPPMRLRAPAEIVELTLRRA